MLGEDIRKAILMPFTDIVTETSIYIKQGPQMIIYDAIKDSTELYPLREMMVRKINAR